MRPVDDNGNGESEDEDTDEGTEPPDQLNIQDDHRADHGDGDDDDNYDQADEADYSDALNLMRKFHFIFFAVMLECAPCFCAWKHVTFHSDAHQW